MLDFRPPADGDWPAFVAQMEETFIETFNGGAGEAMRAMGDFARPIAGFDGARLEATAGAYRHVMQVPGGTLPCTGITWVTVSARWRRRGVLTELMRRLHEAGAAAGEPIAALYAAEGPIYGRFGFGVSARSVRVRVATRDLALLPLPPGRVLEVTADEAMTRFPPVFDAAVSGRPGVVARDERWWRRIVGGYKRPAPGWHAARYLVYVDAAGQDRGIAVVRLKGKEGLLKFEGRCRLNELHAVDAEAAAALWRYAGSFDLVTSVSARMRPSDDPLPFMLPDIRSVRVDADEEVWVHVTDPVAALSGRRYLGDGVLTVRVADSSWPRAAGTYRLEVSGGVGSCSRVDGEPDLEMDAADLGAIYLGDTSPVQLEAAGRVVARRPGAAEEAARIFRWAPAAWGPDMW
jgi:predicted acetyltransferase